MGAITSIGWTRSTRNMWMGCSKVHEVCPVTGKVHVENGACNVCYVERLEGPMHFKFSEVKKMNWERAEQELKSWDPRLIFLNDFTDWMHPAIPDEERKAFWELLLRVNDYTYSKYGKLHQFQMLTKRAERLAEFTEHLDIPENFWMGVSIGNKPSLKYLHWLREVPAWIRFVSFEPLVEDLEDNDRAYRERRFIDPKYNGLYQTLARNVFDDEGLVDLADIQWIIIGGESGAPKLINGVQYPRPMKEEWALRLIKAARKYGVKTYFKQMGGPIAKDGAGGCIIANQEIKEFPDYHQPSMGLLNC